MAERGIREYHAKKMLVTALTRASSQRLQVPWKGVLVSPETNLHALAEKESWLKEMALVAKPDQLFGKRGKNNLIYLNKSFEEVKTWLEERMNKEVVLDQGGGKKVRGTLTHFLIEPYFPHEREYYFSIVTQREGDILRFHAAGGVDIEEVLGEAKSVEIPITVGMEREEEKTEKWRESIGNYVDSLLNKVSQEELLERDREVVREFIISSYMVFVDYHFTYLEFNPFAVKEENLLLLDTVAKLDDYASYQCAEKWKGIEFPKPFGSSLSPEERRVEELDSRTGASLKLTVLNPKGRIWNMVAGGGASVIYADTVVDLGYKDELANYGEYSGNPSTEDTYEYTKVILDLMTREKDREGREKYLLVGGGIANFTDVAKTFTGIIRAIEKYKDRLKECDVKIYVRRGGPNYKEGLRKMKKLGERLGLPVKVYGPELHMTRIVSMALKGKEADVEEVE